MCYVPAIVMWLIQWVPVVSATALSKMCFLEVVAALICEVITELTYKQGDRPVMQTSVSCFTLLRNCSLLAK